MKGLKPCAAQLCGVVVPYLLYTAISQLFTIFSLMEKKQVGE